MTDLTRQIVDHSARDEGAEAREAFYAALHDRVMAHIEAHKQDVAKTLITPEEENVPSSELETEQPTETEAAE